MSGTLDISKQVVLAHLEELKPYLKPEAYEEIRTVVGGRPSDSDRMDWLERDCFDIRVSADGTAVTRASDGVEFHGGTLRDALDAVLADEAGTRNRV